MNVIFNEIDYQNDCFEIYNPSKEDLSLDGWTIIDKNKNQFTIHNLNIKKDNFIIFHKNEIKDKLPDVKYQKIDFKISSVSEKLYLYDKYGRLVDTVFYDDLTTKEKSYLSNALFV